MQENPTNQPNLTINEVSGNKLPSLYKLIEQFGKNRVTALNIPASSSKTLIEHRDLVLTGTNRKMYILSLYKNAEKQSLMIADYRAKEGITRTMFFDGTTFQESIKVTRAGTSSKAQRSRLSEEEQIAFINELNDPMVNIKSTGELPITTPRSI